MEFEMENHYRSLALHLSSLQHEYFLYTFFPLHSFPRSFSSLDDYSKSSDVDLHQQLTDYIIVG